MSDLDPKAEPHYLVAEFISPPKVYAFSFIVGNIIPKSVKCIHSATKITCTPNPNDDLILGPVSARLMRCRAQALALSG